MGYILGEPTVQQYFDANGDPLENGTIEFFIWNTSTPTAIYSDSTGTSAGTSVTLNSIGAPANGGTSIALFFDTTVVYKIVRKDSAGSAIAPTIGPYYASGGSSRTVDTIAGIFGTDSLYDYTGTSNGDQASVAGYYVPGDGGGGMFYWNSTSTASDDGGATILPTGHAGTGRWIRIIDFDVSVLFFGALGDGATDDIASIQAAVAYAKAEGGQDIHFPPGVFLVSQTIDVADATGVRLIGEGGGYNSDDGIANGATSIKWTGSLGSSSAVIKFRSTQTAPRKATSGGIVGIQVDCNEAAEYGIFMTSVNSYEINDVSIWDSTVAGLICGCLDDSFSNGDPADTQNNWFDRLSVKTASGACIRLQSNGGLLATTGANTSLNRFGQIALNIRNNDGFVFGGSDANFVAMLKLYMPTGNTGRGLVFEADNGGNNNFSRQNALAYVETAFSEIYALAGDGTQPSIDNTVLNLSLGNSGVNNMPVIEAGAGFSYGTPRGSSFRGYDRCAFVNGTTATYSQFKMKEELALITTETMRIWSGNQNHIALSTQAGSVWSVAALNGANGDFLINRKSGTGNIALTAPLKLSNQTEGPTSPSAGAGGALPATPEGYLTIVLNGVNRQIPFY